MKLTIITINKNNADGLKKTIGSVLSQTYKEFEYIVVDGASEDGSVEIVNKADFTCLSNFVFVSEPDTGIYNAMNKGIMMASGDYLLFLNSGDSLADANTLSQIESFLSNENDMVIGRVNIAEDGVVKNTSKALKEQDLTLFNMYLWGIPHQASFIKRKLFDDNLYDENLKINSDWKFFIKTIVLGNAEVTLIDNVIANYDGEGISSRNMTELLEEREKVFRELIPERIADNYLKVFPHYYETVRIGWLLKHKCYFRMYKFLCTIGNYIHKD